MRYVYVLDVDGKPLMPTCRYGKVRRMLKSGQAKVVSTVPFTIRLTYRPKMRVLQPVTVGIDPGRTNIGLAAIRSDGADLYRAHCETRNKEIPKLMAVREQQNNVCLLCGKSEVEHFHHIVPRSRRGSNTVANIAGLCRKCHDLVHKSQDAADRLEQKKQGLQKQFGGTSVLNQIILRLVQELTAVFPGHTHVHTGMETKAFREKYSLAKDHDTDAYCIAASCLNTAAKPQTEPFEILQFRKHNRANIHHQTERTWQLDGKTVAKNRKKRMNQKTDSLQDWFEKTIQKHGIREAERLRSRLTVKKSTRYYNNRNRVMPGTVFQYKSRRYIMTGQHTKGLYYRAYGYGNQDFLSRKARIVGHNEGLIYAS